MGILIPRQLTKKQYIKLFSNPVSGIAADLGDPKPPDYKQVYNTVSILQKIRYSKSMMLDALTFWYERFNLYKKHTIDFYKKNTMFVDKYMLKRLQTQEDDFNYSIDLVKNSPDSFLFSHGYIRAVDMTLGITRQKRLLSKKYPHLELICQEDSLQLYHMFPSGGRITSFRFTVFPNEHPYIPKQKITKVGMTDRGNVYVLHKKEDGIEKHKKMMKQHRKITGEDKKTVQAPKLWNKDIAQTVIPEGKLSRMLRYMIENQSKWRIDDD